MRQRAVGFYVLCLFALGLIAPNALASVPEPQTVRLISTSPNASPAINGFHIYATDDEYGDLAIALQDWVKNQPGTSGLILPVHDLTELGTHGTKQIILGTFSSLESILTEHHMSTLDLGSEGYLLHSEPAPSDPSIWRIIIVANSVTGVRSGMATLLDDIQSPNSTIHRMIIRDYPDRPYRVVQYRLGPITGDDWLAAKKADMDEIAKLGASGVQFPFHLAFDLDRMVGTPNPKSQAEWARELFAYCRSLGMEPIPQITVRIPDPVYFPQGGGRQPLWREGRFIKDEQWNVENGVLVNDADNFDNEGENLTWTQGCDVNFMPNQWYNGANNSNYWQYFGSCTIPGETAMLKLFDADEESSVWTKVHIRPGDYYVLTAKFSKIEYSSGAPQVLIRDPTRLILPNGGKTWFAWRKLGQFQPPPNDPNATITYECDFSVPPDSIYLGNNEVEIGISTQGADDCTIELKGMSIDRRNAGFVNLMRDTDLGFKVTDLNHVEYHEGPTQDYIVVHDPSSAAALSWEMRSNGPRYWVEWRSTPAPTSVLVSCTLGIPAPPAGVNDNSITACFNNTAVRGLYRDALSDIFDAQLAPRYIAFDTDELRHINNCGRCVALGLDNAHYIVNFLQYLKSEMNIKGGAAAQAQFTLLGDMFNPRHNGHPSYELANWLGKYGPTSGALGDLSGSPILCLWSRPESEKGRNPAYEVNWPRRENATASVVAVLQSDNPIPWVQNPTWYANDAMGFYAYTGDRLSTIPLNTNEKTFLDYAWKRYANPDATLQVFGPFGDFRGDDMGGHVVSIAQNQALTFYPFGRAEGRAGCIGNLTATINWGDGTSASATGVLNVGSLNHAYSQSGLKTVTLTVSVDQACNGVTPPPKAVTVQIQVNTPPGGGCTKNCPEGSPLIDPTKPLVTAIRVVAPNPFAQSAVVHFSIEEPSTPQIKIYDVAGRLVRNETLADHPAGAWQWTWDGRTNDGSETKSGIYFVHLLAGHKRAVGRVVKLTS